MRVLGLDIKNFMGIKVVHVRPEDGVVVVGGENGAGKSSLLDAIECGVRGLKFAPDEPIRRGESKGEINLDFGELRVRRRFGPKGSTIKVMNEAGNAWTSPQKLLDDLTGGIAFDPLSFVRAEQATQMTMLQKLAGVDLTLLDAEIRTVFENRASASREVKSADAVLRTMPQHDGVPLEAPDVDALLQEAAEAREHNNDGIALENQYQEAVRVFLANNLAIDASEAAVKDCKKKLADAEHLLQEQLALRTDLAEDGNKVKALAQSFEIVDVEPIEAQIREAGDIREKIMANEALRAQRKKLLALAEDEESLTEQLRVARENRARAIAESSLPVEGLSFDPDSGVTLNGVLFDQCSSAEQIRTSVRIGMATSPKLTVMLIRDGSLLDAESMADLVQLAESNGHQVWIERVGDADEGAILIEEGEVKES